MKQLWIKRFRIFIRRYVLAIIMLFLPFLLEIIFSSIIPSNSTLINSIRGVVKNYGSYELTPYNYSTQTVPYSLTSSAPTTNIESYLNARFSNAITLEKVSSNLNDYVLDKRKNDIKNLVRNYYMGMSLNLSSADKLYATIYFSSMAYHSSANILNEIDNLILYVASNYTSQYKINTINAPLASNTSLSSSNQLLEVLPCLDTMPFSLLNFINSIIVALMIGFMVMHVGRERNNGSKQLQMLSGIHYATYWLSNYCFDLIVYFFNVSSIVLALKIINAIKKDTTNELYSIAGSDNLGYLYLLLLFSMFSWCTLAYIWSFLFKANIMGFVVLALVLGILGFLDMILVFVQILIVTSNSNKSNGLSDLIAGIRGLMAFLFPNITIKRGIYDLKIRSNSYCIDAVNEILDSKLNLNSFFFLIKKF